MAGELTIAYDQEQRDQLWKARKALYPTLYRFDPRKKPINFVDDVVVGADRISELIRYLEDFFGGQNTPVAIFGHIGNGNAHILPLLDVNDRQDFERWWRPITKCTYSAEPIRWIDLRRTWRRPNQGRICA